MLTFEVLARVLVHENERGFLFDSPLYASEVGSYWPEHLIATAYIALQHNRRKGLSFAQLAANSQVATPWSVLSSRNPTSNGRAYMLALAVEQGWVYDTSWGANRYFHTDVLPSADGGHWLDFTWVGNYAVYGDIWEPSLPNSGHFGPWLPTGGPFYIFPSHVPI